MQHYGWLEARLVSRFGDLDLTFRNLAYSGDIERPFRGPIRRPAMHFLPVSDVLAQFEILDTQLRHFRAEFGGFPTQRAHLAPQLLHEVHVRPRPER
jgi:hypothetical protein